MKNIIFSNSFVFYTCRFQNYHHTDKRNGSAYHYIAYMEKGTAKLTDDMRTIEISEGDCFYIPLNCAYRSYWYGKSDIVFKSYAFTYFPNPNNTKYPLQKLDLPETVKADLQSVQTDGDHSCENIGKFYSAFGQISRYMEKEYNSKEEAYVAKAIKYMSKQHNYKIADVAKYCNISESGLYRMFQEVKGATPIDIKHRLQIEKSCNLLSSTDSPIEIIAEKCGFCSATYFRKIFKKITGKTPSRFRQQGII